MWKVSTSSERRRLAATAILVAATSACTTVSSINRSIDVAGLIDHLGDDRTWVRAEAARRLGDLDARTAVPELEGRLADRDEHAWVRTEAARALRRVGAQPSHGVLVAAARSAATPPSVKLEVIRCLCAQRDLDNIEPLTNDADILVADAARRSIATGCGAPR